MVGGSGIRKGCFKMGDWGQRLVVDSHEGVTGFRPLSSANYKEACDNPGDEIRGTEVHLVLTTGSMPQQSGMYGI